MHKYIIVFLIIFNVSHAGIIRSSMVFVKNKAIDKAKAVSVGIYKKKKKIRREKENLSGEKSSLTKAEDKIDNAKEKINNISIGKKVR